MTEIWNNTRQHLSIIYRRLLAKHCPQVEALPEHHLMTVVLPEWIARQAIIDHLRNQGIQTVIPNSAHRLTFYNSLYASPRTEDRELALPLHPAMTLSDVVQVVNCLAAALDAESLSETIS